MPENQVIPQAASSSVEKKGGSCTYPFEEIAH